MTTIAVPRAADEYADHRQLNRAMWSSPEPGLWVARSRDGYLGMVEETAAGFVVTDSRSSGLGTYKDFETARNIVSMEFSLAVSDRESALASTLVIGLAAVLSVTIVVVGFVTLGA